MFFLGTFYFQRVAGHDPLVTGLLFLPVALAVMAGASSAGRLVGRLGGRAVAGGGLVVAGIGFVVPAAWTTTLGTAIGVTVGSLGIGALFVVAAATALAQVAPQDAGVASGLLSTFHEFGAATGAAVSSSLVAAGLAAGDGTGFPWGTLAWVAVAAAVVVALLLPRAPHPDRASLTPEVAA